MPVAVHVPLLAFLLVLLLVLLLVPAPEPALQGAPWPELSSEEHSPGKARQDLFRQVIFVYYNLLKCTVMHYSLLS